MHAYLEQQLLHLLELLGLLGYGREGLDAGLVDHHEIQLGCLYKVDCDGRGGGGRRNLIHHCHGRRSHDFRGRKGRG